MTQMTWIRRLLCTQAGNVAIGVNVQRAGAQHDGYFARAHAFSKFFDCDVLDVSGRDNGCLLNVLELHQAMFDEYVPSVGGECRAVIT